MAPPPCQNPLCSSWIGLGFLNEWNHMLNNTILYEINIMHALVFILYNFYMSIYYQLGFYLDSWKLTSLLSRPMTLTSLNQAWNPYLELDPYLRLGPYLALGFDSLGFMKPAPSCFINPAHALHDNLASLFWSKPHEDSKV